MAYEWAQIGAKCVCINNKRRRNEYGKFVDVFPPPLRSELTIKGVFVHPIYNELSLLFAEHPNICPVLNRDVGWSASRFRPLITKTQEQDVKMFLRLASPSPLERLDLLTERMNELAED